MRTSTVRMNVSPAPEGKLVVKVPTSKYLETQKRIGDWAEVEAMDAGQAFVPVNKYDRVNNILKTQKSNRERFGMESALDESDD